jgi:hypothetical protein
VTTAIRTRTESFTHGRTDAQGLPALVVRLRVAARGLVPFSEARLLLLEAAATIERVDRERPEQAGRPPATHPA